MEWFKSVSLSVAVSYWEHLASLSILQTQLEVKGNPKCRKYLPRQLSLEQVSPFEDFPHFCSHDISKCRVALSSIEALCHIHDLWNIMLPASATCSSLQLGGHLLTFAEI